MNLSLIFRDRRIQVRNKDGRLAKYECCVLGSAAVVADHPSQHLASLNWTAVTYEWARDRRLLRPILMRTGGVVVVDEPVQHPPQMILAENQEVVDAGIAYAADATFSVDPK